MKSSPIKILKILFLSIINLHSNTSLMMGQKVSDVPIRRLSFSVLNVGSANWDGIYYQREVGDYQSLEFWDLERSRSYKYTGTLPIYFYRQEIDSEGFPIYRAVATANIKSPDSNVLLFFVPRPADSEDNTNEFVVASIGDELRSFPIGTITFLNATGASLEGVFGGKPIFLKTGLSEPYRLSELYDNEVLIGLAVQLEGNFKRVLQNRWVFYPDYREIVILTPPKKRDSFRIQAIRLSQHEEEVIPLETETP